MQRRKNQSPIPLKVKSGAVPVLHPYCIILNGIGFGIRNTNLVLTRHVLRGNRACSHCDICDQQPDTYVQELAMPGNVFCSLPSKM